MASEVERALILWLFAQVGGGKGERRLCRTIGNGELGEDWMTSYMLSDTQGVRRTMCSFHYDVLLKVLPWSSYLVTPYGNSLPRHVPTTANPSCRHFTAEDYFTDYFRLC